MNDMSNIEHLIENALTAMGNKPNGTYQAFKDAMRSKHNRMMLQTVAITEDELWAIAQYVVYTWMPSLDAVPVVRCKDCEYFLEEGGVLEPWCDWHEARMIGRGGFCSEGKRKDGDGNG